MSSDIAGKNQLQALKHLEALPSAVSTLLNGDFTLVSRHHKNLIRDTTDYVLKIVPEVHHNKTLKQTLRRILGRKFKYTLNLEWAGGWKQLINGCTDHLTKLGQELNTFYQANNLVFELGGYNPIPQIPVFSETRQFVPKECTFSAGNAAIASDYNQECTYIHFLRLLGLALENSFHQTVSDRLASAGVGEFYVSSGGIKGFQRMLDKTLSKTDHRDCPKPRPAQNADVVRCLVTCHRIDDMKRCCEVMLRFSPGPGLPT